MITKAEVAIVETRMRARRPVTIRESRPYNASKREAR
jgi:hypothetical protein